MMRYLRARNHALARKMRRFRSMQVVMRRRYRAKMAMHHRHMMNFKRNSKRFASWKLMWQRRMAKTRRVYRLKWASLKRQQQRVANQRTLLRLRMRNFYKKRAAMIRKMKQAKGVTATPCATGVCGAAGKTLIQQKTVVNAKK